ncbi:MAG TPA: protealysin inhibitor emfourin [Nocardioides sp.]
MKITVRRTGGFAGISKEAVLDTATVPDGRQVEELVARADFGIRASRPQPDRFNYHVEAGDKRVELGEQDLTEDLRQLVERVLG